jgi:hypothetical protein
LLIFGGDGPVRILVLVLVNFASRLSQNSATSILRFTSTGEAGQHAPPTRKGIEEQLGNKTIDHVS